MGNIIYIQQHPEVEEYNAPRIGYSETAGTNYWDTYDKPKNADYYFSKKRLTYITRGFYPDQFSYGYFYGRYAKKKSLLMLDDYDSDEIEEAQVKEF